MTPAYRWYALGLLAVINLLNYIDRNVIYALFESLKRVGNRGTIDILLCKGTVVEIPHEQVNIFCV